MYAMKKMEQSHLNLNDSIITILLLKRVRQSDKLQAYK